MAQEPSSPGGSLGVKSVDEVQAMIQKSLQLPKVKFLRQRMAEAGCAVKDNFFRAVVCQGRKGMAYFAPAHGIFVCSNHVTFQDEVNQLIIHELIHAYDDCRAVNLHWNNCAHQACSEIRAGHLSGDCHFMRELLRGHFKLRGHEPLPRIQWKMYGIFVTMTHSHLIKLHKKLHRLVVLPF
nr:mitochondrial inner membrane protease ATP23 homolog isoform X3 [Arachis hypogaea]